MKPDKSLGQHWLTDKSILNEICDEANLKPDDVVLEIGPGPGALTKELVRRVKKVIAVEFDPYLAAALPVNVKAPNLEVIHADAVHFDLNQLPKNYKVVANLPYYITSKLARKLIEADNPPAIATLLVQKEVAERMAAEQGSLSILGVATQFYAETELGPIVPAKFFTPPPKVDSQVITLVRRAKPLFSNVDPKQYFRIVRGGFAEKRKKLRSSLSGSLHLDKKAVDEWLQKAQIPETARAQELSLENWHRLTQIYPDSQK